MKPLSLTIQNMRSYKSHDPITFGNASLTAILGNTGAGKSTLLDAIVFALYGETIDSSLNLEDLIAPFENQMMVGLDFSVDGLTYNVHRIKRRRGQGVARLTVPDASVVTGAREVNSAVKSLLGISCETFLKTVLLPQGRFAELLTAGAGARDEIMNDLFNLDVVDKVKGAVDGEFLRVDNLKNTVKALRERLPGDPQAKHLALASELGAKRKTFEQAEEVSLKSIERAHAIEGLKEEQRALRVSVHGLSEGGEARRSLLSVRIIHRDLVPQLTEASENRDAAREMLAQAQRIVEGLAAAGLDTVTLRRVSTTVTTLKHDLNEAGKDQTRHDEATRSLESATRGVKDVQARLATVVAKVPPLETLTAGLKAEIEKHDVEINRVREAEATQSRLAAELCAEQTLLEKKKVEAVSSNKDLAQSREALGILELAATKAREALDNVRRSEAAAFLSAHVHPGESCPVCEQPIPATFSPKASPTTSAAESTLDEAEKRFRAAGAAFQELDRRHHSAAQAATNQKDRCVSAASKVAEHAQVVGMLCGGRSLDEYLPTLLRRREERSATLRETSAKRDQAARDVQTIKAQEAVAQAAFLKAQRDVALAEESRSERKGTVDALIDALPASFRAKTLDEMTVMESGLRTAITEAERADARLAEATGSLAKANKKWSTLSLKYERSVSSPFGATLAMLKRLATLVDRVAPSAESKPDDPAFDAILDAVEDRHGKMMARIVEIDALLIAVQIELDALLATVGGDAAEAVIQARLEVQRLTIALEHANNKQQEAMTLDTRLDRIEPAVAALATLKRELRVDRFKGYVAKERAARLLAVASQYLFDMTHEYEFTSEFDIRDTTNDVRRPAASLSGGEKFQASLALSLAVVDQAAIGGAKLDSLFLDEGFSTLDVGCLEDAMQELRSRARKGRSIWVITHLKDVAAYAHESYMVEKGPEGSQVRLFDSAIESAPDAAGLLAVLS